MSDDAVARLGMAELARAYRDRSLSPVEVTRIMLDRIDASPLHAFATVSRDVALADAQAAEATIADGGGTVLTGVPIGFKDVIATAGTVTASGMPSRFGLVPDTDASVVALCRGAGAVVLGKHVTTEGAFSDYPPGIPQPVTPWHPDLWPGASSSGSGVAVAAGLSFASFGTDSGGSVRLPAAANGIVGFKPSWGAIDMAGVFPTIPSTDHLGPMTRSVEDAALLFGLVSARPVAPAAERSLRIGLDEGHVFGRADAAAGRAVRDAVDVLQRLGHSIVPVSVPYEDALLDETLRLQAAEVALGHADWYARHKDSYGSGVSGIIALGDGLKATELLVLQAAQRRFRARVDALFESVDAIILPVQARSAPTNADMAGFGNDRAAWEDLVRYTVPWNHSGHPALALPGGRTATGLPVGIQFVGPAGADAQLLTLGMQFQRHTDWHRATPTPYSVSGKVADFS